MSTTATNRKIRELLTAVRDGRLEPRPEFQRRLVWANKHKVAFLDTVLRGYPFPEIYTASGRVDSRTGEGSELLVDGQQRITTLNQYFLGSPDLRLGDLPSYAALSEDDKIRFLEYVVVVRDLGQRSLDDIKEIFQRINSTSYSLNAMELAHARFDGALKQFAERVADDRFFEEHRIFRVTEIRRMNDLRFVLGLIITMLSTYFNRDDELETYLEKYNESFDAAADVEARLDRTFAFVREMRMPQGSRVWQKADLLSLLVELDRLLRQPDLLQPETSRERIETLYEEVGRANGENVVSDAARDYYLAAVQASNDRSSRARRGHVVAEVLRGVAVAAIKPVDVKGTRSASAN